MGEDKNMENYIGYWFLPKSQDTSISGILEINDSGVGKLLLARGFKGFDGSRDVELILGILSNGTKVTLINPIIEKTEFSSGGFLTVEYNSYLTIMGEHYLDIEDILFSEVKVSYPYLNLWLNKRSIETSMDDKEDKSIHMSYKMPEIITEEYKGHNMEFTYRVKTETNPLGKFKLEQEEFVRFIFKESLNYNLAIDICYEFSQFLTLCMGEKICINSIFTKNKEGYDTEIIVANKERNDAVVSENNILIKYTYIENSFSNAIKIWSEKKDLLDPIIVYFIEAYEKVFHEPMSFLKIVQAVEAFSRRARNNKIMPQEEFELKVAGIVQQLSSEDDKKLIESILSNEPRLRDRLTSIFDEVNFIFDISKGKRKSLIHKICDTRNYYTHFDDINKYKLLDTIDKMYYATEYMKWTLQALILNELEVDRELIKQSIINNRNIYRMKEALEVLPNEEQINAKLEKIEKKLGVK